MGDRERYEYMGKRGQKRPAPVPPHALIMLFNVLAWDLDDQRFGYVDQQCITVAVGEDAVQRQGVRQLSNPWPWDEPKLRRIFKMDMGDPRARISLNHFKQACSNTLTWVRPDHRDFITRLCNVFVTLGKEAPPGYAYWQRIEDQYPNLNAEPDWEKHYRLLNAELDTIPQNEKTRSELENVLDEYQQIAMSNCASQTYRLPCNTPAHNIKSAPRPKTQYKKYGMFQSLQRGATQFEYLRDPIWMLVDDHKRRGIFADRHL